MDATPGLIPGGDFHRNSGKFMEQRKAIRCPIDPSVKGSAGDVIQDAQTYHRMMDIAARADPSEGIRQSLDDFANGRHHPSHEALEKLRGKPGIPR
jgi:hypothetical protein